METNLWFRLASSRHGVFAWSSCAQHPREAQSQPHFASISFQTHQTRPWLEHNGVRVSGLHHILPIHSLSLGGSRAGPEMQILVKSIQKLQGSMCCAAETHHVPRLEFSSQHSSPQARKVFLLCVASGLQFLRDDSPTTH